MITDNAIAPIQSDIQLTAMLPHEMVVAQQELISWCEKKVAVETTDRDELKQSYEYAKSHKWRWQPLYNQYNKQVKIVSYYEKMLAALKEGFYIVPNFPIDMFAVRTKNKKVKHFVTTSWSETHEQDSGELKIGEGEYKNPHPRVFRKEQNDKTYYFAKEWNEFEFPITMAKPNIMEATNYAMALKIFDKIGIMPAQKRTDPVIIGQIMLKTNNYHRKIVSFMIAWHLNTNVL